MAVFWNPTGSRKAFAIAVRTAGTGRRHTALTHRLHTPGMTHP
jgi:exodeoxyribonuclease V alpha subunit